jgi:hypothetical protein
MNALIRPANKKPYQRSVKREKYYFVDLHVYEIRAFVRHRARTARKESPTSVFSVLLVAVPHAQSHPSMSQVIGNVNEFSANQNTEIHAFYRLL